MGWTSSLTLVLPSHSMNATNPSNRICSPGITLACADWAVEQEQAACFAVVVAAGCASVPVSESVADDAAPSAAVSVGSHFASQPADPLSPFASEASGVP